MKPAALLPLGLLALLGLAPGAGTAARDTCTARSGPIAATVIELYTSEGCSSCPPADRWLSAQRRQPGVVALAFHVNYWDGLGWRDRFASGEWTRRQAEQRAVNGARYSYTPQVIVQGQDRRDWPSMRGAASAPARVDLTLTRDGERLVAQVQPRPGAPARLAGYWAVTEHGHETRVRAGENDGATLRHDAVVRELKAIDAWPANATTTLSFAPTTPADPQHPREVALVVVDAATGRPVQALSQLFSPGC